MLNRNSVLMPLLALAWAGLALGQVKPVVGQHNLSDQVNVVRLAPRYATAIRMPEAVSSVIVGDPEKFLAEHSEKEPALVLVKPVVEENAESNLLVTTVKGRQVSFVLRSQAASGKAVDFVLVYKSVGTFLVEESGVGTVEVPGTEKLRSTISAQPSVQPAAYVQEANTAEKAPEAGERAPLDRLLDRQKQAPTPTLYGMNPPTGESKGDRVRAGVSEVVDEGRTVIVLFSVVNPQANAIEVLPPQIQLAGKTRKGFIVKHDRWGTSEQIAVTDYRLSRRRLGPGERADGVLVFTRPGFKQSNESVFLQVAESGAIDKPALAPIGFGVSAMRKEAGDE